MLCNVETAETTVWSTFLPGQGLEVWVPQSSRPPVVPITPVLAVACFSNTLLFATSLLYKLKSKLPLQVHNKFCFHHEVLLGPLLVILPTFGTLMPPIRPLCTHLLDARFTDNVGKTWILQSLYPPIPQHPAHSKHLINTNCINLFWLKEIHLHWNQSNDLQMP